MIGMSYILVVAFTWLLITINVSLRNILSFCGYENVSILHVNAFNCNPLIVHEKSWITAQQCAGNPKMYFIVVEKVTRYRESSIQLSKMTEAYSNPAAFQCSNEVSLKNKNIKVPVVTCPCSYITQIFKQKNAHPSVHELLGIQYLETTPSSGWHFSTSSKWYSCIILLYLVYMQSTISASLSWTSQHTETLKSTSAVSQTAIWK